MSLVFAGGRVPLLTVLRTFCGLGADQERALSCPLGLPKDAISLVAWIGVPPAARRREGAPRPCGVGPRPTFLRRTEAGLGWLGELDNVWEQEAAVTAVRGGHKQPRRSPRVATA